MANPTGCFQLASSNAAYFANSMSNDVIVRTGGTAQRVLIGPLNNGGNAMTIIDETQMNVTGDVLVNGALNATTATIASIPFIDGTLSNVQGLSAVNIDAGSLTVNGVPVTGSAANVSASEISASNLSSTTLYVSSNIGVGTSNAQAGIDISNYINGIALAIGGNETIDSSRNGTFSNLVILGNLTACNIETVYSTTTIKSSQIVQSNLNVFTNLAVGSNIDLTQLTNQVDRVAVYGSLSINSNAGSVRLFTNGSGFLGVGKVNPTQMIDVNGSIIASSDVTCTTATIASTLFANSTLSNVTGLSTNRFTASNGTIGSINISGTTLSNVVGLSGTTFTATTINASGSIYLSGGNVGVGTVSPSYPLHVATSNVSGVSIFAIGDISAFSDRRVKTDLQVIPDALNKVSQVSGYTYTRLDGGTRQCGVIAQELQAVLPEVVHKNEENGMLSVAYGNIVALLIQSIKELKAEKDVEVASLVARVSELEKML